MKIETIKEELSRYKLLMNYDSKETLSENTIKLINEGGVSTELEALLKSGAKEAEIAASVTKSFESGALKGMKTEANVALKSSEEIVNALKAGTLNAASTAKLTKSLFKQGSTELVRAAAADAITASSGFKSVYTNLTKEEMMAQLAAAKYTKAEAEQLVKSFERNGGKIRAEVPGKISSEVPGKSSEAGIVNNNYNTIQIGDIKATSTASSDAIAAAKAQGKLPPKCKFEIEGRTFTTDANGVIRENGKYVRKTARTTTGEEVLIDGSRSAPTVTETTGLVTKRQKIYEAVKKAVLGKWNWKRILKWCAAIGITGGLLWWYFATNDGPVPKDIPPTPPNPDDTDNGGDGNVYTTPGDPYQYKVVDCVWFTKSLEQRGKIISDWTSLANNQKAIGILDGRFPDARKNCGGNSSTNTNTNTNTNNNTLTPSGTTLNQQYGTEPMANAQAEVQTTNDDINNY
jgi:hypothetical protein